METKNGDSLLLHQLLVFGLIMFLQNIMVVSCYQDQKTYYHSPTDPHSRSSPPPPSGHTPSPHRGSPPANCGSRHHDPTPRPSTPSAPPTGYNYSPPPNAVTPSPPTNPTPTDPGTPAVSSPPISFPTPPFDPNSPPFTCVYWRNHPELIWGVFGFWGTNLGSAFGTATLPLIGSHPLTVQDALANTRTDGLGSLYRQGTASLLNSMVYNNFHFTPSQVRDRFVSALASDKAAASQARLFKLANEGRLKPRSL